MMTCASPPFQHAKADIILRSSDGIDFRVFTLFLNLASSSFDSIIEQAGRSGQISDDLPIVSVEENHRVLDIWLRFCYPSTLSEDPALDDFEDILPVLEAARKYSLKPLENKVRQVLKSRMEKEPWRCFALAMRGDLVTEATLAAEHTLRQPLIPAKFPEIDLITATEMLALLTYHQKCGIRVQFLGENLSWITPGSHGWMISGSCGCESGSKFLLDGQRPLKWWCDYLESTLTSLLDKPSGHTVQTGLSGVIQDVRATGCSQCCSNILMNMTAFARSFSSKVDILTANVHFDTVLLNLPTNSNEILDLSTSFGEILGLAPTNSNEIPNQPTNSGGSTTKGNLKGKKKGKKGK
ncbi:hypothetical protein K503DRAFT_21412 [Rhizopogon vinicolor AM-OR11-026]|uniref:BTB domain-containing protein n=1 Tax=Rhizopogon vinicolor AM-OR11-026 TaxID=1314800 RepID=A0A1B7N5M3_9AGAM|nr:hypothetical protein K503DRAFT_21412 [Rhizopogon vinicolor AM-OR11-026]